MFGGLFASPMKPEITAICQKRCDGYNARILQLEREPEIGYRSCEAPLRPDMGGPPEMMGPVVEIAADKTTKSPPGKYPAIPQVTQE